MADDGTTETPTTEETPATPAPKVFDEAYVGELRRESAKYRTTAKAAEDRVAALEAELATAQGATPTLEARASAAESEVAKLKVALEKGLPLDLVARLHGNTVEELTADADALLELVTPKGSAPLHNYGGGSTEPPPPASPDMNAALRAFALGR